MFWCAVYHLSPSLSLAPSSLPSSRSHSLLLSLLFSPFSVPPAQSVVIATSTSPPYTAGNSLQLTCTATLPDLSLNSANISAQINWRKGEIPLNISNHRISVVDQQTGGSSRVQQLTIDPLSDHLDSGDYVCDVIFSVIGTDIVSPLVSSAETPITVEGMYAVT